MDLIDIGLYAGYLVFLVAAVSAIVLPLINAVKQPSGLLRSFIGVGIMLVLFGVAYALSGSDLSTTAVAMGITETGSKMIGAGLILFYITLIVALLGLIYSEVSKALK
jgi:hypothetical protein